MPTWAMRIAVQRRLGLPLQAAAAAPAALLSKHGRHFDLMGDVASNDGLAGHQSRHHLILESLYDALKRVWGARVQYEPADSMSYSDHRPDLTVRDGADFWAIDLKVFDPIGSDCGQVEHRGAFVACGNTRPEARRLVIGLRARGVAGTNFNPSTGLGHVAAQDGHYARAEAHGVRPLPALFETFGGVGPELYEFLGKAAEAVQNKLSKGEYTTRRPGQLVHGLASSGSASRWRRSSRWPRRSRRPWALPRSGIRAEGSERDVGVSRVWYSVMW